MCFSERISWTTFILGTLLNIWVITNYSNKVLLALTLTWQWVLLVQFFEALIWRNQPDKQNANKSICDFATKGVQLSVVTQPIIMFITLCVLSPVNARLKCISALFTMAYLWWLVSEITIESDCLTLSKCDHLEYAWWLNMSGGAIPYVLAFIPIIFLMVRPMRIALLQFIYIYGTGFISYLLYKPCAIGSTWCWLAALAPVFTILTWK
jgi:hypothetical protein